MKITRTYEVWTGGDMVEDYINDKDYAIKLARQEIKNELKQNDGQVDVVVDEIIHYILTEEDDIEQLEKEL